MNAPLQIGNEEQVVTTDEFCGFKRIVFAFEGAKAWIVRPETPRQDNAWVWCIKWPGAFAGTTGQVEALRRGYHYVTLDEGPMTDELLPKFRRFQKYLVDELGFAEKTCLIGLSWGGFYSIRYASTYPETTKAIYLDNPLLNFDGFEHCGIGAWKGLNAGEGWSSDPRMAVNRAEPIAKAGIPILLMYGDQDEVVPNNKNCLPFAERFQAAGGDLLVVKRPGCRHHPHGVTDGNVGFQMDFFESRGERGASAQ